MGNSNSSSLSSPMMSSRESIENSSKQESGIEGFWVLATKSGKNEKVQYMTSIRTNDEPRRKGHVTH